MKLLQSSLHPTGKKTNPKQEFSIRHWQRLQAERLLLPLESLAEFLGTAHVRVCIYSERPKQPDNLSPEPGSIIHLIFQESIPVLTCTLRTGPSPRPVHCAVPTQHSCGVIAFPALVYNGTGENQAVVKYNPRVAGGSWVSTGYN